MTSIVINALIKVKNFVNTGKKVKSDYINPIIYHRDNTETSKLMTLL
jgi:hypothetical protein